MVKARGGRVLVGVQNVQVQEREGMALMNTPRPLALTVLVVGTSDSASEKDQFLADALFLLSKAPVNSEGSTAESPNHLRNFDPTRCIMIRTFY